MSASWWQHRSLRLRLTLWYAGATTVVLLAFGALLLLIVRQRLNAELDRQLRIDFDLISFRLERNPDGQVIWQPRGQHGDDGLASRAAWFEVWSPQGRLLLRHWPVSESKIGQGLPPPRSASELGFASHEIEEGVHIRTMERPARLDDTEPVVVRVIRPETDLRHTLGEIAGLLAIGIPVAAALSAVGGYWIARRSLAPMRDMAARARQINAESLGERLPVPNPHDELGQLATVFNATLARLESAFIELRRFTADASHELRTPLTALRAVGETALQSHASGNAAVLREAVGSMLEEAQRLNDLVDALLLLARGDSAAAPVNRASFSPGELLANVRETLLVLAAEKNQQIEIQADASTIIRADRTLLRQALLNLLHNAIRYSPADSVIQLRFRSHDDQQIFEVADEGPGIAAEHRERVFERFYRIDPARTREDGSGAGLGLAIAQRAIERQGGRVELASEAARGSVFSIVLSMAKGKAA